MSFITVSFSLTVHVRILLVETFVFQSLKAFMFAVLSTISFLGIISFAWEVIRSWFDYEQMQQLSSEEHNCWKARTASSGPPTAYEIKGGKNGPLDSYCINQFYKFELATYHFNFILFSKPVASLWLWTYSDLNKAALVTNMNKLINKSSIHVHSSSSR